MTREITLTINGVERSVPVELGESLLEVLRREGATSVKHGCDTGDCGACAVLLDGDAVGSCMILAVAADGRTVTTVEGLEADGHLHPLQQAMGDAGAIQCGFCTPGVVMSGIDLLTRNADPSEDDVKVALAGNLCRCTGYVKQVDAVLAAAREMRGGSDD
jgi:aerobic-type carbon monoxide dehydrogenase small subunit (CoxS/CutS family)